MSTGERRKMLTTDAPRNVAGDDHPVADGPGGKLRSMLEYAVLAPSGHNTRVCRMRAFSPASASRSLVNLDQALGPNRCGPQRSIGIYWRRGHELGPRTG